MRVRASDFAKAVLVLEEDAACVPDVLARTRELLTSFRGGWDMAYIGGKPFTHYRNVAPKKDYRQQRDQFVKASLPRAADVRLRNAVLIFALFWSGCMPWAAGSRRRSVGTGWNAQPAFV